MTKWRIEPQGMESLLKTVQDHRDALSKTLEEGSVEPISSGLAKAGDFRGDVGSAVQALFEWQRGNLRRISSSVNSGLVGVRAAGYAYAEGNADMAVDINREMVNSAADGDFTFFDRLAEQAAQEEQS